VVEVLRGIFSNGCNLHISHNVHIFFLSKRKNREVMVTISIIERISLQKECQLHREVIVVGRKYICKNKEIVKFI